MGIVLVIGENANKVDYEYLLTKHTLYCATNVEELGQILDTLTPTVIIINTKQWYLRLEVYLTIKEEKKTRKTPLIIISENKAPHPLNEVVEVSLQESFTHQQLLDTIEEVTNKPIETNTKLQILYITNPLETEDDDLKSNEALTIERTISPAQSLKLLEENQYDCILLDYKLLNTDGVTFYKHIRSYTDTPVILYTIDGGEGLAEKAFEIGIDDYIRKDNVHYSHLIERIEKAINAKKLQRILIHSSDMIENITDAIISIDTNFIITSWNRAAEIMYGWTKEEALGSFIFDVGFFEKADNRELSTGLSKQKDWQGELIHKNKEGKLIDVYASASCLTNRKGEIIGYVTVNRDITEQKKVVQENIDYKKRLEALYTYSVKLDQAETKAEVYRITFDAIHEAIEAKYHELKLVQDNSVNCIYPVKYISKMPIDGPGITTRVVRERKSQLVNNVHKDPDYVMGEDWTDVYSELVVPVLIEGEPVAVINVEHEKESAFKEQDKIILETFAISVSNAIMKLSKVEELEDTIKRRTLELENSYSQLQELDKNKDQFISAATHELRTPLTSIIGYLELMQSADCNRETVMEEYMPIIRRNTDRLLNITDNLLDQQRINMSRLKISPQMQDFLILTRHVLEEMTPLAGERDIKLILDAPKTSILLEIDPVRISQVMSNLIDNAIKFSQEKSIINITVKDSPIETSFTVKDTGYGIKIEDIKKLFKPFPNIEKSAKYRSTGLGLSISKGIIDLHGGVISASSEGLGRGAVFSFSIPKRHIEYRA